MKYLQGKPFPPTFRRYLYLVFWASHPVIRNRVLLALFLMIAASVMTPLSSYQLKTLLDSAMSAASDSQEIFALVLFIAFRWGHKVCWRIYDVVRGVLLPEVRRFIKVESLNTLLGQSPRFYQDTFSGELAARVTQLSDSTVMVWVNTVHLVIPLIALGVSSVLLLIFTMPVLGWIFGVWFIFFVVCTIVLAQKAAIYSRENARAVSYVTGSLVDIFTNFPTVRTFAWWSNESSRFAEVQDVEYQASQKFLNYLNLFWRIQTLSQCISEGVVMVSLSYALWSKAITPGEFVFAMTLILALVQRAWETCFPIIELSTHIGTCQDALAVLSLRQEIVDHPEALDTLPWEQVPRESPKFDDLVKGIAVEFRDVEFSYVDGKSVFSKLSFVIPPGQKVGIVGFSGAGKSTLAQLLLRSFDVTSGAILVDGVDIRRLTQGALLRSIAYVPQEPTLFHRTIRENILYGHADQSEDKVEVASKLASCSSFIAEFPEAHDTVVGERGVKLSGGQRQRIALARTFLKNSPILIFDEATSALDSETEKSVQDAARMLMEGRTTIIIAHRLSTLECMDRIIVLHEGEIVEDGSMQELLARRGIFFRLWSFQSGGFLAEHDRGPEEHLLVQHGEV
jgi:ATP-binding cassette, subfamily B, bacterial